jgi:hypothetical protein
MTKVLTLRELIENLQGFTWLMDKPVAFTMWTSDDAELYADDYKTEDNASDMWAKVVPEVQSFLNEGWFVEQVSDMIIDELDERYEHSE